MASSALTLRPLDVVPPFSSHLCDGSEDIEIYLVTAANASITPLKVCSKDTIASVKLRIQTCKGFYVKQQKLVCGGRELHRKDAMIKDYGVTNGKVVHLVLRLSELQVVTITTISGKEHVFRIDRMKCVRDLKQRLSQKDKAFSLTEQQLVLRGKAMNDGMCIDDLPIEDDGVVHVFIRNTVKMRSRAVGADIELSVMSPAVRTTGPRAFSPVPMLLDGQVAGNLDYLNLKKNNSRLEVPTYPCSYSTVNIPSVLRDLMQQVKAGLDQGHTPILSSEGSGGVYFMQDVHGTDIVGVFKPIDEEPMAVNNPRGLPLSRNGEGLKRGTSVGKGAMREAAAYILDYPIDNQRGHKTTGFAGVPPTTIIKCSHRVFQQLKRKDGAYSLNEKIGSLQLFVHSSSSCEDMGPACFPVHEVHKIAVLDIRLANTDRNGANILVCKKEPLEWSLVPIDHGYCLPDRFEDCTFEWLYWPQSRVPFEAPSLQYISQLDAEADIALLEKHGWKLPVQCARVLRLATLLLKKGASAGLTPYDIGSMMCRKKLHEMSPIEVMLEDVEGRVLPGTSEDGFMAVFLVAIDAYIKALCTQK